MHQARPPVCSRPPAGPLPCTREPGSIARHDGRRLSWRDNLRRRRRFLFRRTRTTAARGPSLCETGVSSEQAGPHPRGGDKGRSFVLYSDALAVAGSRWQWLLERVPELGPEVLFLRRGFLGGRQTRGLLLVGRGCRDRRLRCGGGRGGRRGQRHGRGTCRRRGWRHGRGRRHGRGTCRGRRRRCGGGRGGRRGRRRGRGTCRRRASVSGRVVVLAAVVVWLAVVVLAVLVLAVVAEVVEVVCATGVKVPAGTRLFGEFEDALCAFASWVTAATIACAAVSVVEVVVGAVAAWATGVVVDECCARSRRSRARGRRSRARGQRVVAVVLVVVGVVLT